MRFDNDQFCPIGQNWFCLYFHYFSPLEKGLLKKLFYRGGLWVDFFGRKFYLHPLSQPATKEAHAMRNMLIGLFGAMSLAGCAAGTVPVGGDNDCEECQPNDGWILLTAEDRDQNATLTIEFLEREEQIGQIGWHLTLGCPDVVEFYTTPDELQKMLDDRGYNIDIDNVECVRWNVNYQDGRYLCEGNDNTPYDSNLIADTYFDWSGFSWEIDTWSDPSGEGCSAVACN